MLRSFKQEAFLSPEDLAKLLKLDVKDVYRLLEDGDLPGFRIGDAWRMRERDILLYIEEASHGRDRARSRLEDPSPPIIAGQRHGQISSSVGVKFRLLGKANVARSWIEMVAYVLHELAERDERFLDRFSQEGGRSRRYIAPNRDELYERRPDLAQRFSRRLANGWWLGTNYSRKDLLSILRKACEIAGLEYGVDLVVGARTEEVDKAKAMEFVGVAADTDPLASIKHDQLFAEAVIHEAR
jgi:excisionase family DNA binding protein